MGRESAPLLTEEALDDDGLGYYPDSVKRTLTDEQVAIFRHSEIQTILRERRQLQLQQEDEEDCGQPEGHAGIEDTAVTPSSPEDKTRMRPKKAKRRKVGGDLGAKGQDEDLDYGDGTSHDGVSSSKADLPSSRATTRKVVAYDDLNERHAEPQHETNPSPHPTSKHNFLWPVLGE